MYTKTEYITYTGIILVFLSAIFYIARYSENRIEEDIAYHGKALSSYAWELDYSGIEQYIELAVNSYGYGRAQFYDLSTEMIQADVKGKSPRSVERFLIQLGILHSSQKRVDLLYEDEYIGVLTIFYYNRYLYLQFYVFLIFLLIFFISYLIMNLARAREHLELRVSQRTADLENEINNRRKTEENLRLTLDSIGDGVISTDREGRVLRMNPVAQLLAGVRYAEARGKELNKILDIREIDSGEPASDPVRDIFETGKLSLEEGRFRLLVSRTGETYQISESGAPIRSSEGENLGIVLVFRDMTQEIKLQKQLEHSQRMDAVGQLAGGIAHDFNNMLGGILGSSELLRTYIKGNEKAERMNKLIYETSERAADLTKQLLTFSRKKTADDMALDLHAIINDTAALLGRTLDRRIEIVIDLKADRHLIKGDSSMLQNALINLGINSSHAITGNGKITLATKNIELDSGYCRDSLFDLQTGPYVLLTVEDTGCGIPEDIRNHIFEPFFTTKEQGKGTGLGLAAVYGTVTQHMGEIKVYSEIGRGTAFHLLLPLAEGEELLTGSDSDVVPGGTETVLVVDDDEIMRMTAQGFLEQAGYNVLIAENGQEALDIYGREKEQVKLVLLDMIMPRMDGKECFLQLNKLSPDLPVILSSGFINPDDYQMMKDSGLKGSISKPYRGQDLLKMVHEVLHISDS